MSAKDQLTCDIRVGTLGGFRKESELPQSDFL
jgi:hypothetical protein